jgi:hypothetical protein
MLTGWVVLVAWGGVAAVPEMRRPWI